MVCFQTAQHLWRHELEGAGKPLGGVEWANRLGHALEQIFFRTLREAKIEHLNQALRGDHDVGALEVAMNDAAAVRMAESGCDLHSIAQHGFDRQALAHDQGVQRLAFDQLHDDVQLTIKLADFMDGADIRMAESGRGAGLVQQIVSGGVRGDGTLAQNLQGNITMEKFIARAVDNTHPDRKSTRLNSSHSSI